MKIWIDLTNSPHVLFFRPIINRLKKDGHKIIVTTREHSQTIELLKMFNIKYKRIGKHKGKSKIKKAFGMLRILSLIKFALKEKPDIGICHQSPYLIQACFWLRISSIYIFDNETAKLQNLISIPFSKKSICPEFIKSKKIFGKKLKKYKGIKEMIYLSNFKPNKKVLDQFKINKKNKIVIIRPEPMTAAYYKKKNNLVDEIINYLVQMKKYNIIVIPRSEKQKKYFSKIFGDNIIIPKKVIDGPSLMLFSDIIISGGGTMIREACALGKIAVSTYPKEKLLAIDKYLIKNGYIFHVSSINDFKKLDYKKQKIKKISSINFVINEINGVKK